MRRFLISALAAVLIHGAVLVFFPFFPAPLAPVSQKDTGIAIQITHVLPAPEKKTDPAPKPETPPAPQPEKKQMPEPEKAPLPVPDIEKKPPLPDPPKEPAPTEILPRKDLLPKKDDLTLSPPKPKVPAPEPDVTPPVTQKPEPDVPPVENTSQTAQKMPDQNLSDFMDAAKAFQEKPASVSRESTAPEVRKQAVPLYKKNPRPRYPRIARRRGHTGTVMLMVFVNKIGEAEKLRIFESSGYDSLDHAAETAVADWRFEPGTSNGVPTGMWVKIPITFELKH
jgi:protein TonB